MTNQTIVMNDQPLTNAKTDDKLSLTSLILGVLSLVPCSILSGIPAVITGHIALNRIKTAPTRYGGKGQATAGLVMGYISIGLIVLLGPLAALLLPALAKAKYRAQEARCVNNLKQIGLAARIYANDHNDKWPADYLIMSNELSTPKILVCPGDQPRTPALDWSTFSEANVSYKFLTPGLDESKVISPVPAFTCPVHKNTIGYSDGSVTRGAPGRGNR